MDAGGALDVCAGLRTAKACGPGALVAGAKLVQIATSAFGPDVLRCAGDGDTKAGLAGARTIYAVNTIAQGMPVRWLDL